MPRADRPSPDRLAAEARGSLACLAEQLRRAATEAATPGVADLLRGLAERGREHRLVLAAEQSKPEEYAARTAQK